MDHQYSTRSHHFLPYSQIIKTFQYPHFCTWPDKVHDGFRDVLYNSPLGYLASRYVSNWRSTVFSALNFFWQLLFGSDWWEMPVLEYLEQQLWDLHLGTTQFHSEIYIGYRLLSLTEGNFIFQKLACWLLGIYRHQEVNHGPVLFILLTFSQLWQRPGDVAPHGVAQWEGGQWAGDGQGLQQAAGANGH